MALQFIFGGSGSGKTYHLYQRMIKEAGENPALNYIVLVPEQFTMQTQKDIVLMHDRKGIMNIDVLSFGRLAYRIFEETGKGDRPVLDDEGKNLVLRRIAGECENELRVLRGNIRKPGYISEVKSVISEFDQYDIGPKDLDALMESADESSYLYYKLHDIRLMYEKFQQYLADRYITKEELLGMLTDVVPESELLKRSVIVLDGFTGFTPVQNRLLAELMRICRDVIVTVTIDDREDPYQYRGPFEMFAMSRHTVKTLIHAAEANRVEIREAVWMKGDPAPRFAKSGELAFLERNLFRYGRETFDEPTNDITVHEAQTVREEARAAVAAMRRLARENGYRYREMAVIVTDQNVYGDELKRAFEEYEIPYFMDQKRSILLNSFVEYVRSLIAMVQQQFSYDSVFRFLRAGYGPFEQDDIELLENYCLAAGIRGYRKWQQAWGEQESSVTSGELEHVNHLRVQFIELLDDLMFVLRQRKKTVEDITRALYCFIEKQEMQGKLKQQEDWFTEQGEHALAREYAQVYGAVIELFDKFVELLGTEHVSIEEYALLLDAGLEEAKIGVIPPGLDQVIVGDVERTRIKDIRALFVLGINDKYLPGALLRTGLLGEQDRKCFEEHDLRLTPGGKEKAYIQKFYLYQNLTKPEEKLYLSYSRSDTSGAGARPAYLIAEIRKRFPNVCFINESERRMTEKELTPDGAVNELIEGLRDEDGTDPDAFLELFSWYRAHTEWAGKMKNILDAAYWSYDPKLLSEEAARGLYGDHYVGSISRLERYGACAFAHFLMYGLRLRERDEHEFRPVDLGNVFHEAIEKYSRGLKDRNVRWTEVGEEERGDLVRDCVKEAVEHYGNHVLEESARSRYMITRIERLLDRTVWALTKQLGRGDFEPEEFELSFAGGTKDPERSFAKGKIDRVDLCEDGDELYVKVVDYKTGSTGFDVTAFCNGLQIQLFVYMDETVKIMRERHPDKTVVPSGVFYYRIEDPFVDDASDDPEEKVLQELRMDGLVNLQGNSLEHLDRGLSGVSKVVPVRKNKDGSISKTSNAVSGEQFGKMLSYAERLCETRMKEIRKGNVTIRPYLQRTKSGCDYCNYRHICGFDVRIQGFDYHRIRTLSLDEAMAEIERNFDEKRKEQS